MEPSRAETVWVALPGCPAPSADPAMGQTPERPPAARRPPPPLRQHHGRGRSTRPGWPHAGAPPLRRSLDEPSRTTRHTPAVGAGRPQRGRPHGRPHCVARQYGQPAGPHHLPGRSLPPALHPDKRGCRCSSHAWPRRTTRQIARPNWALGCPPLQRLGLHAPSGPDGCTARRPGCCRRPGLSGLLREDRQALRSQVSGPERPAGGQHEPRIVRRCENSVVVGIDDFGSCDFVRELA